jgi:uncharacterized metal-binding protein YceD (DUF177 family)
MTHGWDKPLKLYELARGPVRLQLAPDEAERAAAAKQLGLVSLPALTADVTVTPWLDGVALEGRFQALVEQECGVSLENFEQPVAGEIAARAVPPGSPNAASTEGGEVELDPDAEDPPDVLAGDSVDVAAYVLEHLALELDPFPRKPGATFEYKPPEEETSPFAALKKLQQPKP